MHNLYEYEYVMNMLFITWLFIYYLLLIAIYLLLPTKIDIMLSL